MEQVIVRELRPGDTEQVAALWLVCTQEVAEVEPIYTPAITQSELQELLLQDFQSKARFGWGIFNLDTLVAYVTCRLENESRLFVPRQFLYLIDLDVAPAYRGNRLSRCLLAEVERFAKNNGIDRLELAYAAADHRAQAVWERLGFQPHFVHMHRHL